MTTPTASSTKSIPRTIAALSPLFSPASVGAAGLGGASEKTVNS